MTPKNIFLPDAFSSQQDGFSLQLKPYKFLFFLFLISLFTIQSCKKEYTAKKMPASVSSFIYAYTSGIIPKNSPIRVRFTSSVIQTDQIGSALEKGIFNLKPQLDGKVIWEDDRTLLFEPTDLMTSGQKYMGVVNLKELFPNAPKDAATFEFDFQVKNQYFNVNVSGLEQENPDNLETQILTGKILTGDIADDDAVEKLLTARQNGKALNIRWEHVGHQLKHMFFVENVQRGNEDSEVKLNWNGKALNVSKKGDRSVAVPAIGNFKVMDTRIVQSDEQYILVQFSDPLLKSQNLEGLVSLSDYRGNLRFIIDGNKLRIYPSRRITGSKEVELDRGIKNIAKANLKKSVKWNITFEQLKPKVRLVGTGVIMPDSDGLIFPFEAVSLNAVEVEVFKIFNNNILQFLQTNRISGSNTLERVGKIVLQTKVYLSDLDPSAEVGNWNRYALDLSQFLAHDPNAIYQLRIGFRSGYEEYLCTGKDKKADDANLTRLVSNDGNKEFKSIWGNYYGLDGYYDGFEWEHRENPCFPAYFNPDNFIRRNVFVSNLGILAKKGKDGSVFVSISDLLTSSPLSGVSLDFYDYQQQLLRSTSTDVEGTARVGLEEKAFVVVATKGDQKAYLKLDDQNALSLSRFDVSGAVTQKGLKGYLYGERGVWRPGDSLYLNFVLEDKLNKVPANHPIDFELYDPKGQLQRKLVTSNNVNNVYPLLLSTKHDDPTGNWRAVIKVGGATFNKTLKIETIKPNRLKIKLDFGEEEITASSTILNGDLQVNWLHGAAGKNLKAKVEMQLRGTKTSFETFKEFVFDDPARKANGELQTIFDGTVNDDGFATIKTNLSSSDLAPGKLKANFKTRAFEKGGDFSTDNFSMMYSPYDVYSGVYIPENKYGEKRLDIDKEGKIQFVSVDADGKPMTGRTLSVGLYKVDWHWWWDNDEEDVSRYNSTEHQKSLEREILKTNGKGEVDWTLNIKEWGRYLVRVCDPMTGHCAGEYFYAGYPWYGNDGNQNRNAAAMLAFASDKKKYNVGEEVKLTIPSGGIGRCLISIESGTKVLETYWVDAGAGETEFSFYATPEMAPTVYANVSIIQPHSQVKNDMPIRMYGVISISVEDKDTRLDPTLKMPDELQPKTKVTIEVAEKNGKAMAYTIAMVDDGLLDLTRFKTPNPWNSFYAREALGVKTWDIYDNVLGAYGGELERILSIGGDDVAGASKDKKRANRFKPVVNHIGPFFLEPGGNAKHELNIPNYVGSVRTMVVASNKGAYGNTEKTTPVRKPLMVLATLPRVLGPKETLKLPVNIFAMDQKVKDVNISITAPSQLVKVIGGKSRSLRFNKPGEEMVDFEIEVLENVGLAKFVITATGAGETASQEIEIEIRNPNPFVTEVYDDILEGNVTVNKSFDPVGMYGTNEAILEISNIPPINLGKRLRYLLRYPHGCIEQTTSSGFPQLYVDQLLELDEKQKAKIPRNIEATIDRLKRFQLTSGGFAYWPGDSEASLWGTNYAGHFLLEAKNKGYSIPANMIERWISFQKNQSQNWDADTGNNAHYSYRRDAGFMQAYRLYNLAMAKAPDLGAMNRLREQKDISDQSKWRLAAAYAMIGKPEVARDLIQGLDYDIKDYRELSYTYGSGLRDKAMILETLTLMNENTKAAELARNMSESLSADRWFNTQAISYSLLAIGKMAGDKKVGDQFQFAYKLGGDETKTVSSNSPIKQIEIPIDALNNKSITIDNRGSGILYSRLILSGQPLIGDKTAAMNNLNIEVNYKTMDGKKLDPSRISQGTDFIAEVVVKHDGKRAYRYEEMALSQIFPSGWEVHNSRMDNVSGYENSHVPTYRDIRDDRVYTYFDIRRKDSHTYRVQLNAAYPGRYYLPSIYCEAMYDDKISARLPGEWIEVVKGESM